MSKIRKKEAKKKYREEEVRKERLLKREIALRTEQEQKAQADLEYAQQQKLKPFKKEEFKRAQKLYVQDQALVDLVKVIPAPEKTDEEKFYKPKMFYYGN